MVVTTVTQPTVSEMDSRKNGLAKQKLKLIVFDPLHFILMFHGDSVVCSVFGMLLVHEYGACVTTKGLEESSSPSRTVEMYFVVESFA